MGSSSRDIWPVVHEERRALLHDLHRLTPEQWSRPSLCQGWDVHDVLAHIVDSAKTTRWEFLRRLVAARFDFDRDNALGVARERQQAPSDTLAELHRVTTWTATPPAPLATRLVEAFVHGEDIRRPLGLDRVYPASFVAAALAYQVKTSVGMGGGKQRTAGLHLVATDAHADYSAGQEVRGCAIALLLAVSGRPVREGELHGQGTERLRARARS